MRIISLISIIGLILIPSNSKAVDITGAGATFPYPIYAKWADTYKKETGNQVNYQSIGSGGGIKQIKAGIVSFGATDAPLSKKELLDNNLVQFPAIIGGIIPVVNNSDLQQVDGLTLSKIFLGNSKLVPVYRSDGSGTTYNFTYYLSEIDPEWKQKVGIGTSVKWPLGVGAKGNEGVANNVSKIKNTIGYVEYAYVKQNKLNYLKMVNKEGNLVTPNLKSFRATSENTKWTYDNGFGVILVNQAGKESWPITSASWILLNKKDSKIKDVLKFFEWAFSNGQKMAEELDYVPINTELYLEIQKVWSQEIK